MAQASSKLKLDPDLSFAARVTGPATYPITSSAWFCVIFTQYEQRSSFTRTSREEFSTNQFFFYDQPYSKLVLLANDGVGSSLVNCN